MSSKKSKQQQRLEVDLKDQMDYILEEPLFKGGIGLTSSLPPQMDEYSLNSTLFLFHLWNIIIMWIKTKILNGCCDGLIV